MIKLKYILEADDIDLGKVFMKGVGPGGEPNPDQLTDEPEKEIEDALDDISKEFKRADLEPKKVDEAIGLTLAGVALSLPAIIKVLGKFVNILKKIPGLKSLSGDKIIAVADKMHHKVMGGLEFMLKKAGVKDSAKAAKFANILFHVVVAMFLVSGIGTASNLVTTGNFKAALGKGALNAVKGGEIRKFILQAASSIG